MRPLPSSSLKQTPMAASPLPIPLQTRLGILNHGRSETERRPTPEHWQAHTGVIVRDVVRSVKLLSVPLFFYGLSRMWQEGVITAGLAYVLPWPLLELMTNKESKNE